MNNKVLLLIACCLFCYHYPAFAFDDKLTHPNITKSAITNSMLADYLIDYIGDPQGVDEPYCIDDNCKGQKTIIQFIQDGSKNEDLPVRGLNHFYNPLNNEGLDDKRWVALFGFIPAYYAFSGEPNRDWAIGMDKDGTSIYECNDEGDNSSSNECNDYSWRSARETYFEALTSITEEDRNKNFIKFYEKLGRVIHLLEDMGVPAHTRNDMFGHTDFTRIKKGEIPFGNIFEFWVKKQSEENSSYVSSLVNEAENFIIPEFTRPEDFLDIETYIGSNPAITMPSEGKEQSGLGEYSNANFLSQYTLFTDTLDSTDKHYFPYPSMSSVSEWIDVEEGKTYLSKDADGETIERFAVKGILYPHLLQKLSDVGKYFRLTYMLNDEVHEAYAEKLIPKTVAYSVGLINYFFRGKIELSVPDDGFYAFTDDPDAGFTNIKLKAQNVTENGDEMSDGIIDLVVKYKLSTADPFQNYDLNSYPPTSDEFYYITVPEERGITSIPRDSRIELYFDLSETPIPLWATDVYLQVIYRGQLGNETDAVAVGFNDISEPTPIDIFNNMDYICLGSTWYVAGSQAAIDYVDNPENEGNNNGEADEWDVNPHGAGEIYLRFFPYGGSAQLPSSGYNHYYLSSLAAGAADRSIYLLTDHYFTYSSTAIAQGPSSNGSVGYFQSITSVIAVFNQSVWEETEYIRYIPYFKTLRGTSHWAWAGTVFQNSCFPESSEFPCSNDLLE